MTATDLAPLRRRHRAMEALAIVALSLALNLAGNGRISLWDRDEPRYAECTREMRQSGDYVRPRFNAEPRNQKPVLIYWIMSAGMALGGDNPFGARLASSVAGAASCLLVWLLGGRMFGPRIGRLAALVLATAPIAVVNAKIATTDACLALFLLVCQMMVWRLREGPSMPAALTFWASLALATLTKGPVGPALIASAGLVSWALGGGRACWSRLRWRWGLVLYVLIAAPWFVAIGLATNWEFYRVAVGTQVIHRVTTGMEQHGGFPGYYLATIVPAFYPWSALLPAAVLAGVVRRKSDPTLGFLLGWAVGPLILLECVKTKLIHYYLPAYPACALLVAWLVAAVADSERNLRRWPLGRMASGILAGVGLTLMVVALGGAFLLPWSLKWPCLALAVVIGGGTFFAVEQFREGRAERAAFALAGTWAAVLGLVGAWMLPAVEPYRLPMTVARALEDVQKKTGATPILATFQEPSIIYALGRPTLVMRDPAWFAETVQSKGAVVMALAPREMAAIGKIPGLSLSHEGEIAGFNLSKGQRERLELVVVRPAEVASRPAARR